MTNATDALLTNNNPPITPTLSLSLSAHPITKQQQSLGVDELGAAQALDDARLRHGRVGGADAAPEVRRQVRDWQVVGDEG